MGVGINFSLEDVIFNGVFKKICSRKSYVLPKILITATALPLSLFLISTAGAQTGSSDGSLADLEARASVLDTSRSEALASLVGADSEVDRYTNEISDAGSRRDQVQSDIQAEQERVTKLQDLLGKQRTALEKRLCTAYKSDDMGYLDAILGAGDFNDFVNRVDMISMIADEDRQLIDSINTARQAEEEKIASLTQKQDELDTTITQLSDARANLVSAQAEQQQTIAEIEADMQFNDSQMAELRAQATAIETRMDEIQTAAEQDGSDDSADTPAPSGGSSMTMNSTAYCMEGTTATGMPVGRGIIAVDPDVIPLGTRVYVSGYGDAIAADVGGAIIGNMIDVWLPCDEAYAWGTRTVEVTIY